MSTFRSRYKQPFYTINDGKQERQPVMFFALYQHESERDRTAEEWRARKSRTERDCSVRTYMRHIRVDTLVLEVYVLIVRQKAAA